MYFFFSFQYIQLKKGLYKLQLSLTEYFCTILTIYHHGQKSSFQDSRYLSAYPSIRIYLTKKSFTENDFLIIHGCKEVLPPQ